MPMTFDTYSSCSYKCLYCFSYFQRIHSSKSYVNNIKYVNVEKRKKLFRGEIKNKVKEKRKEEIIMTERMKEIVAEALNVEIETLKEDTSFKEDLGADSLDLFELVMAFEEEFGVEIPSEDLEKITTIKDAAAYMEAHKE